MTNTLQPRYITSKKRNRLRTAKTSIYIYVSIKVNNTRECSIRVIYTLLKLSTYNFILCNETRERKKKGEEEEIDIGDRGEFET